MILFLVSYAITPLRRWLCFFAQRRQWRCGKRLSDWNILIYNRKMFGVSGYYYACVHLLIYFYLELDFDWVELVFDMQTRTHVLLGIIAWILLTFMAVTSPCAVQKVLRHYWRKIHRVTYPIAIILCFHLVTEAKLVGWEVMLYIAIVCLLSLHRLYVLVVKSKANQRDDGMMVER